MKKAAQLFTFPKEEKLTHKKMITRLFEEGDHVKRYPFKILYLPNKLASHQIAIGVPKRKVKLAVNRNKIKRRFREAYRLNKHLLQLEPNLPPLAMMLFFYGDYIPSYQEIETNIVNLFQQLIEEAKKNQ